MTKRIVVVIDEKRRARMDGVAKMGGLCLSSWVRSELIRACEASQYFAQVDRAMRAKEIDDSIK